MSTARQRAASALVEIFGTKFLRAMTEPARIEIVRVLLVEGPLDVGELAGHVPQERSVVSRHLRVLEGAGIVAGTRVGKRRVFALDGLRFLAELEAITAKVRTLTPACCAPLPDLEPAPARKPAVERRRRR
jgi:DNA-binding transcriptional ArsR family regulator